MQPPIDAPHARRARWAPACDVGRSLLLVMALLVVGIGTWTVGVDGRVAVPQLQAERAVDLGPGVAAPADPVVMPQPVKVRDVGGLAARSTRGRALLGVLVAMVVVAAVHRAARFGRDHTASRSVAARLLLPDRRGPPRLLLS